MVELVFFALHRILHQVVHPVIRLPDLKYLRAFLFPKHAAFLQVLARVVQDQAVVESRLLKLLVKIVCEAQFDVTKIQGRRAFLVCLRVQRGLLFLQFLVK